MSLGLASPSDHLGPPTKKWPRWLRGSHSLASKRFGRHGWLQFCGAVGAESVGLRDFAFAIRAGRVQVTLTVRAEVKTRSYGIAAPRAGIGQRLAHEQVNDQADDADGSREHE